VRFKIELTKNKNFTPNYNPKIALCMTKIRFYLKSQYSNRETSIFAIVNYGDFQIINSKKKYKPFKYYIGESIYPKHWNKRTHRARCMKQCPKYTMLNQRLYEIENTIYSIMLEFKINGINLNFSTLRKLIDSRVKKHLKDFAHPEEAKKSRLFKFIESFIYEMKNSRAASTILQYKNTLRLLSNYAIDIQYIDFEDINLEFYTQFHNYMHEAGYSETYFGNQIKFIRLFMNEATERGYNTQTLYKSRKFLSPQPQTAKIYLTTEEIERIKNLPLNDKKKLAKSRDMFIIACKTGLRFSDLIRLNPTNFTHENQLLCITTQKTGAIVHIPLSKDVLRLCRQYNFQFPAISNVTFNRHIRELSKMSGIVDMVDINPRKRKDKGQDFIPKYELVTAHTARRSFATNAFLAKIPTLSIMKITGHNTEQAFMKYIRISGEDNARNLLSHPYFL